LARPREARPVLQGGAGGRDGTVAGGRLGLPGDGRLAGSGPRQPPPAVEGSATARAGARAPGWRAMRTRVPPDLRRSPPVVAPPDPGRRSPIVGRSTELGGILQVLAHASNGEGGIALLEGEAGIGKTFLLKAALCQAEDLGFRCFCGAAEELERHRPFGAISESL